MPELPEVETIVRGLAPNLVNRSIRRISTFRPDVLRQSKISFSKGLKGRTVNSVSRRGKNIIIDLTDDIILVVNLGMTGRLLLTRPGIQASHIAVRFTLDKEPDLVFDDVRRFGSLEVITAKDWELRSQKLGPEPLSGNYTNKKLQTDLAKSSSPIRSWLLDQHRLAGIGNIYANEALHLAGINPLCSAKSINKIKAKALHRAIRAVLRSAIRNRGTTLRDYRDSSGAPGKNAAKLKIYGRAGKSCHYCSGEIVRSVFGNRPAFYCPSCQPEPKEKRK